MKTLGQMAAQSAALLNDAPQLFFTFDKLRPYLQKSFEEMVLTLDSYQVQIVMEHNSAIPAPSSGGITLLATPPDFLYPLKLQERMAGSSDSYDDMYERDFAVNITPTNEIKYWAWNGDQVRLPPHNQNAEVLLYYVKSFLTPQLDTDQITVQRMNLYMESRAAAMAAALIMQDDERAAALDNDAAKWLDMVVRIMVRTRQGVSSRRRPYGTRWTRPSRIIIS